MPVMSPILKPCGLQLGLKLLPNGSNLGPSCAILEPRWAEVGATGVQVGPKLERCWPKLTPSGADFAAVSDDKGAFRRCCADMQNGLPRAEAVPV